MKLFPKLLLFFTIVIALFVSLNVYSVNETEELKTNSHELDDHGVQPSLLLIQIGQLTENTRVQMVTALAFKNSDATKIALQNLDQIQTLQQQYAKSISSLEAETILKNFNENWGKFDERVRLNEQLMTTGQWDEATAGIQAGKPLFEAAQANFVALYEQQAADVAVYTESSNSIYQTITRTTMILTVLTTLIAIAIAYFFSRQIVRRVEKLRIRAEQIAKGDLTGETLIDNNRDELTHLNHSLNDMQQALTKVVTEATSSSQNVSASAEELSATTEESLSATESIAQLTQQTVHNASSQLERLVVVNTAVTELYTNVQTISTNGEQMGQLSRTAFEKTQTGAIAIENVNNQIHAIAESSQQTEEAVATLNAKSQEITHIVGMITQIADQTNLLALNAAIEAARAGESGKGFAVVADEVRKLAEQSKSSAAQIHSMILDIQTDIETVIQSIHEETSRVQEGLTKSNEVTSTFAEIEAIVSDVKESAGDINATIMTIHHLNEQILTNTTDVQQLATATFTTAQNNSESTDVQLSSIEEISAASESLAHLSEQLQSVITHFKLK